MNRSFVQKPWVQILFIMLVAVLAYANIFGNGFVIDDQYFIKEWSLTRNWSNAGQMILGANPPSQPGVYRPVRSLLYLLYFQLFGTHPIGYHLHSLAVHLLSTFFVYFIIKKLIGYWSLDIGNFINAPFVGALMFGLHPIHTESITYIAASMEMTGAVFFFASFYTYLHNKKWVALISALLAFFTYEMTLTLPLFLVLYELTLGESATKPCPRGPLGQVVYTLQNNMKNVVPFFVIAGGYLAVRFSLGVGLSRGDYLAFSPYHTWLTMTKMVVKYISLLVFPMTLSHNHTVIPGFEAFMTPYSDQAAILRQSILDPEILGAIGAIGGIGMIGWKIRKKYPLISFGIGWVFISLLPVLYIFPQGTAFAEKYLYIASVGWMIILAYGLGRIREIGKIGAIGMIGAIGVIGAFYGIRTYMRNADWRSPIALWEHETLIHPDSELAFYSLGVYYAKIGQTDKAITSYQKAVSLKPKFTEASHNLNLLKNTTKQE
ncbi:hypothetical protein HY947_01500 [Candidatus Gottesmanbacteria bacterium]|nr:hypothetical protein [Candidatus Gottesmanbacteria bacterium]